MPIDYLNVFFISTLSVKHYAVCFSLVSKLSCVCFWTLRDIQKVLREDKERLRQMQKSQPHFSSDQRRELVEEHPWMRRGGLPAAINVKVRTTHVLCFSNINSRQFDEALDTFGMKMLKAESKDCYIKHQQLTKSF